MNYLSYYLYKGVLYDTDSLRHWGVLGMKWGVRRYQNKDGTLTAAGKKRYQNKDGSLSEDGKEYLREYGGKTGFEVRTSSRGHQIARSNRVAVIKEYDSATGYEDASKLKKEAYDNLMNNTKKLKEAGYIFGKNLDPDQKEHNSDLVSMLIEEEPAYNKAVSIAGERFTEKWREATLKDFGFDVTDNAMEFMRKQFVVPRYMRGLDEEGIRRHEFERRTNMAIVTSNRIRDELSKKDFKTVEERNKAIDDAFKKEIRKAENLGNDTTADELQQQWAFVYDDLETSK